MQILGDQSAPGTLELELPESKLDRRLIRCSARGRKRSATTTSSGAGTVRREKFENPMMMMRERERERGRDSERAKNDDLRFKK
jgi:hypothetical protein